MMNMVAQMQANMAAQMSQAAYGAMFGPVGASVGAMGGPFGGIGGMMVFGGGGMAAYGSGFARALASMTGRIAMGEAMGVPGFSRFGNPFAMPARMAAKNIADIMSRVAIPGNPPPGAGNASGQTGGASNNQAAQGSGGGTKATGTDDADAKQREAERRQDERTEKARKEQESRAKKQRADDARKQLDTTKKTWEKKLTNPKMYGYTKAEAESIIKLVMDNIDTSGDNVLGAANEFEAAIQSVPRRTWEGERGKAENKKWQREFAEWAATQKGAKTQLAKNLAVDPMFRVKADIGRNGKPKLRDADYVTLKRNGTEKDPDGKVYDRYEIVKKDGRNAGRLHGDLYQDSDGKWYSKQGDKFAALRGKPKFNPNHLTLNLGRGKLVFDVPNANRNVNQIIDQVKPDTSAVKSKTAGSRVGVVKGQLEKFFGDNADVKLDGSSIKITPKDPAGKNAEAMRDKIEGDKDGFDKILGNLVGTGVTVNGKSVASADSAINALKASAVRRVSRAIDIRQADPSDNKKDVKVTDANRIADRVADVLIRARKIDIEKLGKIVVPLRFAKDCKPEQKVLDDAKKKIEQDYGCKVEFVVRELTKSRQQILDANDKDPKKNEKRGEIAKLMAARMGISDPNDPQVKTAVNDVINGKPEINGKNQRLPFTLDEAIGSAKGILVDGARKKRATIVELAQKYGANNVRTKRAIRDYKTWHAVAKPQLEKTLGVDKAKKYEPAEIEEAAGNGKKKPTRTGRGGGGVNKTTKKKCPAGQPWKC